MSHTVLLGKDTDQIPTRGTSTGNSETVGEAFGAKQDSELHVRPRMRTGYIPFQDIEYLRAQALV